MLSLHCYFWSYLDPKILANIGEINSVIKRIVKKRFELSIRSRIPCFRDPFLGSYMHSKESMYSSYSYCTVFTVDFYTFIPYRSPFQS